MEKQAKKLTKKRTNTMVRKAANLIKFFLDSRGEVIFISDILMKTNMNLSTLEYYLDVLVELKVITKKRNYYTLTLDYLKKAHEAYLKNQKFYLED